MRPSAGGPLVAVLSMLPHLALGGATPTGVSRPGPSGDAMPPPAEALADLRHAVDVMQREYFEIWVGRWPTAIDWTAAVMNTHVVDVLGSLSRDLRTSSSSSSSSHPSGPDSTHTRASTDADDEINRYFAQNAAYYFGEDILALRNEAFDDMLWVVLGWLEAIKFVRSHSHLHFPPSSDNPVREWHGSQYVAAFAHRARLFYELTTQGWDTRLCGGGMIWNPNLGPYKNAITNELYIAASVGMYLYHPGDDNPSKFTDGQTARHAGFEPTRPLDPSYLRSAVDAYDWFKHSNMTNRQGLVVDGFHITGWRGNDSIGTGKCDDRNEMVYTYNQAVLLSGLRGLWESSGDAAYLEDGHELLRNAIRATGWDLARAEPTRSREWAGLGRAGVLEDDCDSKGQCSQDAQTFKGIFFHHLTLFCDPLPLAPRYPGTTYAAGPALASLHRQSCREYARWVAHNARAAITTRDGRGRFGGWWGSARRDGTAAEHKLPDGAIDYRNPVAGFSRPRWAISASGQGVLASPMRSEEGHTPRHGVTGALSQDANDGGRGRTVETQGGGVAVLHALWELLNAG